MVRGKLIAGIIIALFALPIILGGVAIITVQAMVQDNEGYYMTPYAQFSESPGVGYVIDFEIEDHGPPQFEISRFVHLKIKVESEDKDLFVGIGPADEVKSYLRNTTYYELTNVSFGWEWDSKDSSYNKDIHVAETGPGGPIPAWEATQTGKEVTLKWEPEAGDWTVLVRNLDFSDDCDIQFKVGAKVPLVLAVGIGLVVIGGLLTVFAILLIYFDIRQHRVKPVPVWATREIPKAAPGKTICMNCGTPYEEQDVFCTVCGDRLDLTDKTRFRTDTPYEEPHPQSDQLIVANFSTRFWAFVIDLLIVGAVVESIRWSLYMLTDTQYWSFDLPGDFFVGFGPPMFLLFAYWFVMEWHFGQSIGKMALNLEVVDQHTGESVIGEAPKVAISVFGKAILLPIDFIIGLILQNRWEEETGVNLKQRLFQRVAGTTVVRKRTKITGGPASKRFKPDI